MFFLQTNGSGVLSFAGVSASAGQVIQVITATDSTERSTSSTSFVTASNTLSVTITPSSASNKILVIASFGSRASSGSNYALTLFRGATNLGSGTYGMARMTQVTATANVYTRPCLSILDSPSTTSATTYQVYISSESADVAYINPDATKGTITCMEIKG